MNNPLFGTAGNADLFFENGYKDLLDAPKYLSSIGLDAYEYQGGHGVRITQKKAQSLKANSELYNIKLSVHSPYYISVSGEKEEIRNNSINYILESAKAAKMMGAERIVVHSGSCSKISREEALLLAKDTFLKARKTLDENGLSDILICPETMGKLNQLGTVDEVVEICSIDERFLPCVDFGHVYARNLGKLTEYSEFENIFDIIENKLGSYRMKNFHSHFSHIEYTEKGGEKRHITFEEGLYGPEFSPVAELCLKKNSTPVFICESRGTQDVDALTMKKIYLKKVAD